MIRAYGLASCVIGDGVRQVLRLPISASMPTVGEESTELGMSDTVSLKRFAVWPAEQKDVLSVVAKIRVGLGFWWNTMFLRYTYPNKMEVNKHMSGDKFMSKHKTFTTKLRRNFQRL